MLRHLLYLVLVLGSLWGKKPTKRYSSLFMILFIFIYFSLRKSLLVHPVCPQKLNEKA
jgi:hypothetical protein